MILREIIKFMVREGRVEFEVQGLSGFYRLAIIMSGLPLRRGYSLRLKLRSAIRVEQIIIFKMVPVLTCVPLVIISMELIVSNVKLDVSNVGKLMNVLNVKLVSIFKRINA